MQPEQPQPQKIAVEGTENPGTFLLKRLGPDGAAQEEEYLNLDLALFDWWGMSPARGPVVTLTLGREKGQKRTLGGILRTDAYLLGRYLDSKPHKRIAIATFVFGASPTFGFPVDRDGRLFATFDPKGIAFKGQDGDVFVDLDDQEEARLLATQVLDTLSPRWHTLLALRGDKTADVPRDSHVESVHVPDLDGSLITLYLKLVKK